MTSERTELQHQLLCFARVRELTGKHCLIVGLPPGATVQDLRRRVADAYPSLAGLLEHCAIAVNDEFAEDSLVLSTAAEVALLPPVSGGEE